MTGPKGNSEFVSTRPSNIEVEDQSLNVFYTSQLKTIKKCKEIVCCTPAGSQIFRSFKEYNLITFESKVHVVASLRS